jgi:multiple sugar transport system permease protein
MDNASPGNVVMLHRARRISQQKDWVPYVFLAPLLIFFVFFFLLPIGFSFYLTLTRWNGLSLPRFVGLENYSFILGDAAFRRSLLNTLLYASGTVFLGIPLALLVAFTFTESRFRAFWRSVYWLPMITNVVAIAYLWVFILDGRYGLFNRALGFLGINGPNWLTDPASAMWAVIIVTIWTGLGSNMLLFSAGLEGIDASYTEAAQIDGAGLWQGFWYITLPLLRPTLLFVTVTSLIGSMGAFALILTLTNGGPAGSTSVAAFYMYQTAFEDLRLGRASAAAFVLFVIIAALTAVQLRLFRRGGIEAY